MAPYSFDYENALARGLSAFRYTMDAHFPPGRDHKKFLQLNNTSASLKGLSQECYSESHKCSFDDDKRACAGVAKTLEALAETLDQFIENEK